MKKLIKLVFLFERRGTVCGEGFLSDKCLPLSRGNLLSSAE